MVARAPAWRGPGNAASGPDGWSASRPESAAALPLGVLKVSDSPAMVLRSEALSSPVLTVLPGRSHRFLLGAFLITATKRRSGREKLASAMAGNLSGTGRSAVSTVCPVVGADVERNIRSTSGLQPMR